MKHVMLAVGLMALMAIPALGDWTEGFQAYDPGSAIDGQGGWAGWGGAAVNGIVTDAHAKFSGDLMVQEAAGDDLVHELSGYTSGAWVFSTKVYVPLAMQGRDNGPFVVLMNNYGAANGWGAQVSFDLKNSMVLDADNNEAATPLIYDTWATVRVEIDLEANYRVTYYNGQRLGTNRWYDPANANNAKSIAAVDLWADAGGDSICYDDLSLVPGTLDLTTYPGRVGRYLVNLGRDAGLTSLVTFAIPSGLYEITSAGGNQQSWWRINDGDHSWGSVMVTFGGRSPDYFGYKFKLPATVKQVTWWNAHFRDGGTFAATPELQYLDAVNGTWKTISDVTWDTPYVTTYTEGSLPRYTITLNNPPKAIWGIRLFGATQPGADDSGDGVTGFIGATEMTLYGNLELDSLDLLTNLASSGTAILSDSQFNNLAALTNGNTDPGNYDTTWSAAHCYPAHEDYVGVTWPTPQNNVAAIGVVFNGFEDGGYFKGCKGLRVEYTTDGINWNKASGLKSGRYDADWAELRQIVDMPRWNDKGDNTPLWGMDTGFLFRFDAVSGITGLRLIGWPDGYSGDADGFIGVFEVEVFANKVTGSAATSVKPNVGDRIVSTLQHLWTVVAL